MNSSSMKIYRAPDALEPARLPLTWLGRDWYGEALDPAVGFAFGVDPSFFHFVACRASPARCLPDSEPGQFQAELWTYDVAEFFLGGPDGYLEFNLAPNGAWWSCAFGAPLQRQHSDELPLPGVVTESRQDRDSWQVSARIPIQELAGYPLDQPGTLNATFILDSPDQRFVTAGPPATGAPNFHRPDAFPPIALASLPPESAGD